MAAVVPNDLVVFAGLPRTDRELITAAGYSVLRATAKPRSEWLIKRVVAVPGDPVPRTTVAALANVDHDVVPEASFVVLGDNPPQSHDSRRYGYVTADRLLGTVIRMLS